MLLNGIEIDECPTALLPEQVVPLEITMTDALANQTANKRSSADSSRSGGQLSTYG